MPCNDIDLCVNIAKKMLDQYNCYPIFYKFNNKVFCRISAQIYNELSDYIFAANTFLTLLKSAMDEEKK